MNYILDAYPQYTAAKKYFGRDATAWIAELEDLPTRLPLYLAKSLRDTCISHHWLEGTLALQKAMEEAFPLLWSGKNAPISDCVLLVAVQEDDLPLFRHFLGEADFQTTLKVFLPIAPQYDPNFKTERKHLPTMLEELASKLAHCPEMSQWVAHSDNRNQLEKTLALGKNAALWEIFAPHVSFDEKWISVTKSLLEAESSKQYFHADNELNKQLLGLWGARPDVELLTDDLRKMVGNHSVFHVIASVATKDVLQKNLDESTHTPRTRRL